MKIAIFSDVHANLPALESVWTHMSHQKPDAVYCLGDLVNQNVWSNEVVEFIRFHNVPCVQGNHDEGIGNSETKYHFAFGGQEEYTAGIEAIQYTLAHITQENKDYLKSLPLNLKLEIETGGMLRTLVFAHGTPSSNKIKVYRFLKKDTLAKILEDENADILLLANTHASFHKILESKKNGITNYQHIINPGSVGYPKDGSWHACYAIINIDTSLDIQLDANALKVDFFRLDYDINQVIKAIQTSPLSLYYAGRLLKY